MMGDKIRETAYMLINQLERSLSSETPSSFTTLYRNRIDQQFENLMEASLVVPVATYQCETPNDCVEETLTDRISF